MQIIKRTISLEQVTDRNYNSQTYGIVTATTFYINVMLTQTIDDMGLFTDVYYLPNLPNNNTPVDYSPLAAKLLSNGITFPFMLNILPSSGMTNGYDVRLTGKTDSDYYTTIHRNVTGVTESRREDVKSYDKNQEYKLGFDMQKEPYVNYSGQPIIGVTRVTSTNPIDFRYVFDANPNDPLIGQIGQNNGLLFIGVTGRSNDFFSFKGEGLNQTNTSLSALTKEEYLFGIISIPEIKNDVFIDRGITTVLEKHLKLSEIRNIDELSRYGNNYYNVTIK